MGGPIDTEWKGCESIGCYTHFVTFNFDFNLDLGFQGQILKKSYFRNGVADRHGIKEIWVDRILHPCCDFQLSPPPSPWLWIFKVKFWNSLILWMGWPFDMEQKGCESIKCWTHVVTFNVHLFHDLDLGFSRLNLEKKVICQEWDGRLTWKERDVGRYNVRLTLWLQTLTSPMTLTLDFEGKILKLLWLRNGRVNSLGMKGMWVVYDVGCTIGLTLGHGAWQIDRPSNGSMRNSYSLQPVGQWMGYSFTDHGAEGCR